VWFEAALQPVAQADGTSGAARHAMAKEHLFLNAFREMPPLTKVGVVTATVLLFPGIVLVAGITAISLFPLFLVGMFEGDLGRAPVKTELGRLVRNAGRRTDRFFA